MNSQEQIKQDYHDSATAIGKEIQHLRARGRQFVTGEIASFLGIIAFIALITISDSYWMKIMEGVMAAMMVVCYIIIRNKDTKNSQLITEEEQLQRATQHEEAALSGDFSAFDDGERFIDPHHPFTYDLDIFGKESLYQRINRTGLQRVSAGWICTRVLKRSTSVMMPSTRSRQMTLPTGAWSSSPVASMRRLIRTLSSNRYRNCRRSRYLII